MLGLPTQLLLASRSEAEILGVLLNTSVSPTHIQLLVSKSCCLCSLALPGAPTALSPLLGHPWAEHLLPGLSSHLPTQAPMLALQKLDWTDLGSHPPSPSSSLRPNLPSTIQLPWPFYGNWHHSLPPASSPLISSTCSILPPGCLGHYYV